MLKALPVEVSPNWLRNRVARQKPEERARIAKDIDSQIQQLQAVLNQRLAVKPRPPEIAKEIDELNKALNAKRQAYDFARGIIQAISPAAAESTRQSRTRIS